MAGNQHSLEKEHAFGWWLASLSFSPTSSLSPNVCPWSAHDLPMVAPIFTGGHCKNAKKNCNGNFFSIFQKFWKIAIFFEKNRFFLIFLKIFSKILNLGSPNTPFRTSTVDKKKLQFLRSENIHKKEKHAATYDVVRARPSCIWKARWSVVSLGENQSFSKWMLKHRLICTCLL